MARQLRCTIHGKVAHPFRACDDCTDLVRRFKYGESMEQLAASLKLNMVIVQTRIREWMRQFETFEE